MAAIEFVDVTVGQLTGVVVEQTGHVGQFAEFVVVAANEFTGVVVEQTGHVGHVGQFSEVVVVANEFAGVVVEHTGQFTGTCVGVVVGTVKFRVQASLSVSPNITICPL